MPAAAFWGQSDSEATPLNPFLLPLPPPPSLPPPSPIYTSSISPLSLLSIAPYVDRSYRAGMPPVVRQGTPPADRRHAVRHCKESCGQAVPPTPAYLIVLSYSSSSTVLHELVPYYYQLLCVHTAVCVHTVPVLHTTVPVVLFRSSTLFE